MASFARPEYMIHRPSIELQGPLRNIQLVVIEPHRIMNGDERLPGPAFDSYEGCV